MKIFSKLKGFGALAMLVATGSAHGEIETVAIAGQTSPGGPGVFTNNLGARSMEIWDFADDGRVAFQTPLIATSNYPQDALGLYVYEEGSLSLAAQLTGEPLLVPTTLAFVDKGYLVGGLGGELRFVSRENGEITEVSPSPKAEAAGLEDPALTFEAPAIKASGNLAVFRGVNSSGEENLADLFVWEGGGSDWSLRALDFYEENLELGQGVDINADGDVYSWNPVRGMKLSQDGNRKKYAEPSKPTPDGTGTFSSLTRYPGFLNARGELIFKADVSEFNGSREAIYLVDGQGGINEFLPDRLVTYEENKRFGHGLGHRLDDEGRIILLGLIADETGADPEVSYGLARFDQAENLEGLLDFDDYDAFTGAIDGNRIRGGPGLFTHAGGEFVAFHWVDRFDDTEAIYMYDFDSDELRKVVEVGVDIIDGSVVESIEQEYSVWIESSGEQLSPDYINANGQVVFIFELEDGRRGIARWSPQGVGPLQKRTIEVTGLSAFTESPEGSETAAGGLVQFSVIPAIEDAEVRWKKNGIELEGRTGRTLVLDSVTAADSGSYQAFYRIGNVLYLSGPAELTVSEVNEPEPEPTSDGKLINISTRGFVGEGANAMFAGFVVEKPVTVLVRASSQILTDVGLEGAMSDPVLQLFKGQSLLATNDTWDVEEKDAKLAANAAVGAFGQGTRDASILIELEKGIYSAQVTGKPGDVGLAIVEVYELPSATEGRSLINISTRGQVGSGADAMFAGFVVDGPKKVLIRASSQVLTDVGLEGAMEDPQIDLFKGSEVIAQNDDWTSDSSLLKADAGIAVGAFAQSNRDSALLLELDAGIYSIQVSGYDGGTGMAIVEVYDLGDFEGAVENPDAPSGRRRRR